MILIRNKEKICNLDLEVKKEIDQWCKKYGPIEPHEDKNFWYVQSNSPKIRAHGSTPQDCLKRFEYKLAEYIIENTLS